MFDLNKIKKKNICIMGLMGSGKTIIGRDLSKYLNIKFFDTDNEIELKTKKSIEKIFAENGERYFREIEEKICVELLTYDNCVISLGGGTILDKKVREKIKSVSYCIYLKVKINELVNRLKNTTKRPLLKNVDIESKINNLYKTRKVYYNKANLIVENNGNKNETLKIIKNIINV